MQRRQKSEKWDKLIARVLKADKTLRFEELEKVLSKIGYTKNQPNVLKATLESLNRLVKMITADNLSYVYLNHCISHWLSVQNTKESV